MTTTDKLAAALKTALERLDAVGACEDADVALFAQARTALAEYEHMLTVYGRREDAAACVRACQGISDAQLREMPPGSLADAYDVCSDIVEVFGFATLDSLRDTGHYPLYEIGPEMADKITSATCWAREIPTTQPEKQG